MYSLFFKWLLGSYLGSFCCSWMIFLPGQISPNCDWWRRDCSTVSLLFTSRQTKAWHMGDDGGRGGCGGRGTQYVSRKDGNTVFMLPTNGLSPWSEGRHTACKNTLWSHSSGSMTEAKCLREPYPNRSGTCRLAAQGHPDYLTAGVVSKAVHSVVIKPVSSCFLQLSGKEEKKTRNGFLRKWPLTFN